MSLRVVGACDHDGRASGRLVIDGTAIRSEVVCDCGQVLAVLGYVGELSGTPSKQQRAEQAG